MESKFQVQFWLLKLNVFNFYHHFFYIISPVSTFFIICFTVLIYGRSHCLPQFLQGKELFNYLTQSPHFVLDVLYTHEPPTDDNKCEVSRAPVSHWYTCFSITCGTRLGTNYYMHMIKSEKDGRLCTYQYLQPFTLWSIQWNGIWFYKLSCMWKIFMDFSVSEAANLTFLGLCSSLISLL